MQRFYQITLIILAPLAIVGGKAILEFVLRHHFQKYYTFFLALLVFTPLFLFQTNFVYEVTGDKSYNITLSMYRWNATDIYDNTANAQEVVAAQWISKNSNLTNTTVYSDSTSIYQVLKAYGSTQSSDISNLIGRTTLTPDVMVYIANTNLIQEGYVSNVSVISSIIENQNVIYSNGQSQVCQGWSSP